MLEHLGRALMWGGLAVAAVAGLYGSLHVHEAAMLDSLRPVVLVAIVAPCVALLGGLMMVSSMLLEGL